MAALASEQDNLRGRYGLLGPTLEKADAYFGNFAEALPSDARVRAQVHPRSCEETPATITAAGPWLTQFTALVVEAGAGRPAGGPAGR